MGKNRFSYDTITRNAVLSSILSTDFHPSFPPEYLRSIWTDYTFRTKYGSGSGWGYWVVTSTTKYIDFNDGTTHAAILTEGNYDADSLATEIGSKMTAVGGQTYTCSYSNTTNKFTISAPSNFTLKWSTGTNKANSVAGQIGYDDSQDDTGSNSYVADYMRIHNRAGFEIDSWDASSVSTDFCALFGLNLTASYQTLKLQRYSGGGFVDVGDFTYNASDGSAIIFYEEVSATKYRVVAQDWTNPDLYAEFGVPILGRYQEISRGYEYGASITDDDTSEKSYSKGGYLNIIMGYNTRVQAVSYEVMAADVAKFQLVWSYVMKRYPFVFVEDSDNPSTTMSYVIFRNGIEYQRMDEFFQRVTMVWEDVM